MGEYKTLNRELIYTGKIFSLVQDTISMPDGRTAKWDMVQHNGAVCVLPVDSDGNIIFVRQFRQAAEGVVLELPAGRLEPGEDPILAAHRELEEETAFKAGDMRLMVSMYMAVGYSNELIHMYAAKDLYPGKLNLDEDEFIDVEKYSLDEAVKMIFSGEIIDSKTIAGILMYKNLEGGF